MGRDENDEYCYLCLTSGVLVSCSNSCLRSWHQTCSDDNDFCSYCKSSIDNKTPLNSRADELSPWEVFAHAEDSKLVQENLNKKILDNFLSKITQSAFSKQYSSIVGLIFQSISKRIEYSASSVGDTIREQISILFQDENNFSCLRNQFADSSFPSFPDTGLTSEDHLGAFLSSRFLADALVSCFLFRSFGRPFPMFRFQLNEYLESLQISTFLVKNERILLLTWEQVQKFVIVFYLAYSSNLTLGVSYNALVRLVLSRIQSQGKGLDFQQLHSSASIERKNQILSTCSLLVLLCSNYGISSPPQSIMSLFSVCVGLYTPSTLKEMCGKDHIVHLAVKSQLPKVYQSLNLQGTVVFSPESIQSIYGEDGQSFTGYRSIINHIATVHLSWNAM
jgi:hypothetical protein